MIQLALICIKDLAKYFVRILVEHWNLAKLWQLSQRIVELIIGKCISNYTGTLLFFWKKNLISQSKSGFIIKKIGLSPWLANTSWNAVISPNFLVLKFCGKAQFPHSSGQSAFYVVKEASKFPSIILLVFFDSHLKVKFNKHFLTSRHWL